MSLSLASHGIWKTAAFLTGLSILFSLLIYTPPSSAQGTGELCSGANLDLGNSKRSCQTESGVATTSGGKLCKNSEGVEIACSDNALNNLIKQIVNVFSILVGVVAVIMIIYGGFRYITSGGDSGSVENAKKTLIYAIVGLVIVALAQIIVKFVLNRVTVQPAP